MRSAQARDNACGSTAVTGWYVDLHFASGRAREFDLVIAGVHTQPTDESGKDGGKVLHVGVGMPRLMVVTADTCSGPRAYAGRVSSDHEHITQEYKRLTEQWSVTSWCNAMT
jgi:hypothetical protein